MKTLVTGASGFIGKHLVRILVEKERDVRRLVRKSFDIKYLDNLGEVLLYEVLLNNDSLKGVAKDCNIVYHSAAEIYSNLSREFYSVN